MMRVLKLVANALVLFVVLPVAIVAVLGMALSPLQASAYTPETSVVLDANDK